MKAHSMCFGISDATSRYPCPYCTIKFNLAKSRYNCSGGAQRLELDIQLFRENLVKEWSYCNKNQGARSHKEAEVCLRRNTVDKIKGYVNLPIFDFVEF